MTYGDNIERNRKILGGGSISPEGNPPAGDSSEATPTRGEYIPRHDLMRRTQESHDANVAAGVANAPRPPASPQEILRARTANDDNSPEATAKRHAIAKTIFGGIKPIDADKSIPVLTHARDKQTGLIVPVVAEKKLSPRQKGYLKSAFAGVAGGALVSSSRFALSTGLRHLDLGTGIGSAITGGVFAVVTEVRKDFRQAKLVMVAPPNATLRKRDIFRHIWSEHKGKYGTKFAIGAGTGFASAWGMGMLAEHTHLFDSIRSAFSGLGDWWRHTWDGIKEKFSGLTSGLKNLWPFKSGSLPVPTTPSISTVPAAAQSAAIPAPSTPAALPAVEAPVPQADVVQLPDQTVVGTMLSPKEQLEKLATGDSINEHAKTTIELALHGKGWAQNEVIDGLYNGRFGFTQNRELASKMLNEFSTRAQEKLATKGAAALTASQQELLLKLAYMEYHPATGFDTNKQHAVDIVKKLGRSWYGGEALLEKAPPVVPDIKHDDIIQQVPIDEVVIPAPATPPVVLPAQVEALNCRAFENAPDAGSAFKISCQNTSLKLSPGDSVPFNIQFNDGTAIQQNLKMGETLLKVPQDAYLESALTSSLNEAIKAHAAEAAPQLTVAR